MQNPINLATSQPGVFYSGSSQMAIGGCNVDDNTKLLFKTTQPDLACRLNLNERPYKAVPFMGRGPVCSDTESQLQQGDTISSKKSVGTISDQSYLNYSNYVGASGTISSSGLSFLCSKKAWGSDINFTSRSLIAFFSLIKRSAVSSAYPMRSNKAIMRPSFFNAKSLTPFLFPKDASSFRISLENLSNL